MKTNRKGIAWDVLGWWILGLIFLIVILAFIVYLKTGYVNWIDKIKELI